MTKMFYATEDNFYRQICQDAKIQKFKTMDEVIKYLHQGNEDFIEEMAEEGLTAKIVVGEFGDCWQRLSWPPRVGHRYLSPFSFRQINVRKPGQHPGGNCYWIKPTPPIYVMIFEKTY